MYYCGLAIILNPLSYSIMFNLGITTFTYVCGCLLCVEAVNQSLVINGLTND